jgi:ABC-type amino acid transport substrate-binding protein
MKLIFICSIMILLGGLGFLGYRTLSTRSTDDSKFVVGIAAGYAPFVSMNEQGEYEGFDIDFARALATDLGKKVEFKDLGSMVPLFISLEQGSIDAIIWGLSITQDRLKKVAMVHYQGEKTTSYPLIFWQTVPAGVTTLSDMKGKIICVEPTSSQGDIILNYPDITLYPSEKIDDALLSIRYGKADAALVEPAIAQKFKNKHPEIAVLEIPLAEHEQVQGIGIALKKSNSTLIAQVEQAVKNLQNAGVIKNYEEKWGIK